MSFMFEYIDRFFYEQISAITQSVEPLTPYLAETSQLLAITLENKNNIFLIASPKLEAIAAHFVEQMRASSCFERPILPVFFVNTLIKRPSAANGDIGYEYAQTLHTLCKDNDIIIAFVDDDDEHPLMPCWQFGDPHQLTKVLICAHHDHPFKDTLNSHDIHINLHADNSNTYTNMLFIVCNVLTQLVERHLFNHE